MRMKKSCDGCKASGRNLSADKDQQVVGVICSLGYKCEPKYFGFAVVGGIPQEICPKPITWKQYDEAMKENHT